MNKISRRNFLKMGLAMGAAWALPGLNRQTMRAFASTPSSFSMQVVNAPYPNWPMQTLWPGKLLPQFVQELPQLLGGGIQTIVADTNPIELEMREFQHNVLPAGTLLPNGSTYSGTWVFGYRKPGQSDLPAADSYIGPVIAATRGTPTEIKFVNRLKTGATTNVNAFKYSIDQTLHWADPDGLGMYMPENPEMGMVPPPDSEWAKNYTGPIPAVPHLHGGEVPAVIDGGPDAWFTSDGSRHGKAYYSLDGSSMEGTAGDKNYCIYRYPNQQEPGLIWFHDHTLGATRVNVYCGLAGGYLIDDPSAAIPDSLKLSAIADPTHPAYLPTIPLVIQDRSFDVEGQFLLPSGPPNNPNPEHPYWVPEFVGDSIVVNGKLWPYLNVEPRRYRFLVINGSNARTYELFLTNIVTKVMGPALYQIGTDGGYLDTAVKIDPNALKGSLQRLVMMPGERADIIVDFSGQAGQTLVLKNIAKTPYPGGETPDGNTLGKILQIRVNKPLSAADGSYNPAVTPTIRASSQKLVRLTKPATGINRQLTLNEIMGMPMMATDPVTGTPDTAFPGGPMEILVNNTKWAGREHMMDLSDPRPGFTRDARLMIDLSELPAEGDTELWEIVNLTADAHPMHLHLVQFQAVNRQSFDVNKYKAVYALAFGGEFKPAYGPPLNPSIASAKGKFGGNPDVDAFLKSVPVAPAANEMGWKDTLQCPPGMVTRFLVRFAPTTVPNGQAGAYPFDPSNAEGSVYVWHCHIVDHEDNEMMRPYTVKPKPGASRSYSKGTNY